MYTLHVTILIETSATIPMYLYDYYYKVLEIIQPNRHILFNYICQMQKKACIIAKVNFKEADLLYDKITCLDRGNIITTKWIAGECFNVEDEQKNDDAAQNNEKKI